ncbi:unnamed protein product [Trifolium pratense]|uniref:Uncharacterized protein n=1 Tax=Trifolium pratense TaxID=57577 RepID=A0ACB0IF21_TRIPR|nr:unnamed protein product [Trifolium pratense]
MHRTFLHNSLREAFTRHILTPFYMREHKVHLDIPRLRLRWRRWSVRQIYLTDIFHPANQMELNDVECHLAAYIFSPQINKKIDENEIMVSTEIDYTIGTRKLLQCLRPNQSIGQDVIDLVATMLTHDERSNSKILTMINLYYV